MPHATFADLARRTSRWTTNLLASGLVVVVIIGLGRQYLNWGREDVAPPAARPDAHNSPLFDLPAGVTFGADGGLTREEFQGTKEAAIERLRSFIRETASDSTIQAAKPSPAEEKMLALTQDREPVESDAAGGWRLYQFDAAFPFTAAVVDASTENSRRLAAWGLAAPAGENQWSLYLWRANGGSAGASTTLALPDSARRSLSLRSADGGEVTAFHGEASPAAWKAFFDAELPRRGYTRDGDWHYGTGIWYARFRAADSAETIDIQFTVADGGRLRGLLTRTP